MIHFYLQWIVKHLLYVINNHRMVHVIYLIVHFSATFVVQKQQMVVIFIESGISNFIAYPDNDTDYDAVLLHTTILFRCTNTIIATFTPI